MILLEGLDELAGAGAEASSVGRRAALGIADLFDQVSRLSPAERPLTIATSVAPWHLDPRWFGIGRFDRLAFVPPPGWEARLNSECVWLQFWVELPTAAQVRSFRTYLEGYAA